MVVVNKKCLSKQGEKLLNDSLMSKALFAIASDIGVTPEEYLLRFETILETNPESIFKIFEISQDKRQ